MNSYIALCRKMLLGLLVTTLCTTTAYAGEFLGISCIDITTDQGTERVLELAVSSVNENYYSLNGRHRNAAGDTLGLAVGSALSADNNLIVTVNASTASGATMQSTLYQFNFETTTWTGTFQSTSQKGIGGSFSMTESSSGSAAIPASCEDMPVVVEPTSPAECVDTGEEVCGDGLDNDCNGVVDDFFLCYVPTEPEPTEPEPTEPEPTEPEPTEPEPTEPVVTYPSFKDNKNGTLTQDDTNLMWQQVHLDPVSELNREAVNWHSATDYCDDLKLGGHTNWRLPTIEELEGIVDTRNSPTINPLFTGTEKNTYWSSTELEEYNFYYTASVNFANGETKAATKQSENPNVRCVRSR